MHFKHMYNDFRVVLIIFNLMSKIDHSLNVQQSDLKPQSQLAKLDYCSYACHMLNRSQRKNMLNILPKNNLCHGNVMYLHFKLKNNVI